MPESGRGHAGKRKEAAGARARFHSRPVASEPSATDMTGRLLNRVDEAQSLDARGGAIETRHYAWCVGPDLRATRPIARATRVVGPADAFLVGGVCSDHKSQTSCRNKAIGTVAWGQSHTWQEGGDV
jgi:hypothetical protein